MSKPMVSLGAEAKSQNSGRRAFIANEVRAARCGRGTAYPICPHQKLNLNRNLSGGSTCRCSRTHPPCVCLANQYLPNGNLFLSLPLPGIPLSLHNLGLLARL